MKDIIVYCINESGISDTKHFSEMTDEEFIEVADGYTLSAFEKAFNQGGIISSESDVIRIIKSDEEVEEIDSKGFRERLAKRAEYMKEAREEAARQLIAEGIENRMGATWLQVIVFFLGMGVVGALVVGSIFFALS